MFTSSASASSLLALAITCFACSEALAQAPPDIAEAGELVVVDVVYAEETVGESEREAFDEACEALGLTRVPSATSAPEPTADALARYVAGIRERETGADFFYRNAHERALEWLTPWLEALRSEPAVLAHHPDLAPGTLDAMVALARAHRALGQDAQADDALADVARLFWGAPTDDAMPPSTARAWADAVALIPTRSVALDIRGADGACALLINGLEVGDLPDTLEVPDTPLFVQVRCDEASSAIHAVPHRATLRIDLAYDDAARSPGLLSPRSSTPARIARLVAHHGWASEADLGIGIGVVRSDVDATFVELVAASSRGEDYRAARVSPGAAAEVWQAALRYVAFGEEASDEVVAWTDGGSWAGLVRPAGRTWTWASAGLFAGASTAAIVLQVRDARAQSALDACARPTSECVFEGRLPERRRARVRARRDAGLAWALAGSAAVATVVAAILERDAGPRDADLRIAPTLHGAQLRARF